MKHAPPTLLYCPASSSDAMLIKLEIPAGVYANGTEYQVPGRWRMANRVRWKSGYMAPIRGWQLFSPLQLMGRPSDIHQYRDGADRKLAIGTHTNLYGTKAGELVDITPMGYVAGRRNRENAFGYGFGVYGRGAYGVSTPETGSIQSPTNWTLDNFGNFLVACANSDGKLYFWDGSALRAEVMPGAPTNNEAIAVTEERFIFALGAANNPSLVQWSDQEDFQTWNPAPTNQAGDIQLQTSGAILNGIKVRGQMLILTTTDAHVATYLGPPLVYGFERVGSGCGALGPQASVATDSFAAWMGRSGFFVYDGFVKPIPSDVYDYVYNDLNFAQAEKVAAWDNSENGEIWWHYPSSDSVECNRYVAWSYRENHWTIGTLDRVCGSNDGVYELPILASPDGFVYSHEIGFVYDGIRPFAETSPVEMGNGDQVYMAKHLYPDEKTQGDVTASFRTRFYPNGPEYSFGPFTMKAPTDVRFTGRQMVMRVDAARNTDWRFGTPRLEVAAGGIR